MSLPRSVGLGSAKINSRSSPFCRPQGFELCHHHRSPLWVRHHLSEVMRLVDLRHTKMVRELTMLRAAVSLAVESVLGCTPGDTFRMEVVGELAAKF
jgi:hypothetical protein